MESWSFKSNTDQLPLTAYRWLPATTAPTGIVVISHGLGEHARRYSDFAGALNRAGYAVYSLDHRGHGESPGPNGLGDFGSGAWDALVSDVGQLVEAARSDYPDLPVCLFAHSMGSFAGQQLLIRDSRLVDAAILSGTAALDQFLAWRMESGQGEGGLKSLNAGFEPARTDYDWLSRDNAQVDKYIADPLCGFDLTPESSMSMAMSAPAMADPKEIDKIRKNLPILLLAGDNDPVTGNLKFLKVLQRRYQDAGIMRVDTLLYPEGRHEMLNETNKEEVYKDVIEWMKREM